MNIDQFFSQNDGQGIDLDGAYGNQCVDLINKYVRDVLGISPWGGNAIDKWSNYPTDHFDRIENTPTGVPTEGDIVVWGSKIGQYGHVAIFSKGDANAFDSFDQNWPIGSVSHFQHHTYNGVLGWLRFKAPVPTPPPAPEPTQPDPIPDPILAPEPDPVMPTPPVVETVPPTIPPVIEPPMADPTPTTPPVQTAPPAVNPVTVTPGWKTTEFWTTLFVHLLAGLTMLAGLSMTGNQYVNGVITAAGAIVGLLNQLGYTNSRTILKVTASDNAQ